MPVCAVRALRENGLVVGSIPLPARSIRARAFRILPLRGSSVCRRRQSSGGVAEKDGGQNRPRPSPDFRSYFGDRMVWSVAGQKQ